MEKEQRLKSPKERVKEITDQLEQGVKEMFQSENYKKWLKTMGQFHRYSLNNTLLIAFQKPDATYVAGFNAWKAQFGRHVTKGQHAIRILAPYEYKQNEWVQKIDPKTRQPVIGADGKPFTEVQEVKHIGFRPVSVFDVSQTEGPELPTLGIDELSGSVSEYQSFLKALMEICPVPVRFDEIDDGAKGFYHLSKQEIVVKQDMSEVQTIKTLIHEMSHQRLHSLDPEKTRTEQKKQTRESKEVEAESIAYTVCQHYGIETSDYSFAYVATWSQDKSMPELRASLQLIQDTASAFITEIDEKRLELTKEKLAAKSEVQPDEEKKHTKVHSNDGKKSAKSASRNKKSLVADLQKKMVQVAEEKKQGSRTPQEKGKAKEASL